MGKHSGTDGPWEVVEHLVPAYPDLRTYDIVAPRGYTGADGRVQRCGVAAELDNAADARLIAASPALLEACEQALANSIKRSEGRGKWTGADQRSHEALRAAIALAREGK